MTEIPNQILPEQMPLEAVIAPPMKLCDTKVGSLSFGTMHILHPRFGWLTFALPEEGINVFRSYLAGRDGAKQ